MPKVANPAPLGLAAFGVTTVVLSCINAGVLPKEAIPAVVPLAFAVGGLAQLITGALEFKNGNTFGTVAFTAYGTFWCWYSLLIWTVGAGWLKPPAAVGVGATLLMWGVFSGYMWICTFKANKGVFLTFLLLWITFFLLAAADFGWTRGKTLGGVMGLATGLAALYVSFAEMVNGTFSKEVLPLGKPIIS
ncbi:MAG TPA: acetate uptake transporter [Terriglobales bacterium]|nr:acetate uptake transporter [Terriglobales bacterium]